MPRTPVRLGARGERTRPARAVDPVATASTADPRPALASIMAPDWAEALAPVEPQLHALGDFLRAEVAAGREYLPRRRPSSTRSRAPCRGRVLVVGQDPYPTPGHPMGLSFSVQPHVRPVPRSLQNIFAELADDVGAPTPRTATCPRGATRASCSSTVLTSAGRARVHRGQGWEAVTEARSGARRARRPAVAILWGATPRPCARCSAHPRRRERPPEPALRAPRVLRVAPVLARQRAPRRPGRRPRRLDPPPGVTPPGPRPPGPRSSRWSWLVLAA
nr:uracil-DNA glycosylase [Cellulosimicrobium sp. MM]